MLAKLPFADTLSAKGPTQAKFRA